CEVSPPITATTVLICTVLPSGTLISVNTPDIGAGISASTLSVEISKSGSSFCTASPAFFSHLIIVPSKIDSALWGMTTSVGADRDAETGLDCDACGGLGMGADSFTAAVLGTGDEEVSGSGFTSPELLSAITATTALTSTVSPSGALISASTPATGDG